MTDFIMNDHKLSAECQEIAEAAIAECVGEGEKIKDHEDEITDYLYEAVDSHQWAFTYYYAIKICAECNVEQGEEFLQEVGMPECPTFAGLATSIAYGEMLARCNEEVAQIKEERGE